MRVASPSEGVRRRPWPLAESVVALWVVAIAALCTLGADLLWVVALGDRIRATGTVPRGIPFASAPQVDWPNPLVLAEVGLSLVHSVGPWALAALHLLLVAASLLVLVAESRRLGGGEVRTSVVVSLAVVGGSAALVVARLPSLSLLPFVLLVALLRRQHEAPTRALWLAVPLVALWGNLHGAVLVGVAVLAVFLVASPGGGPLLRRAGVGAASVAALFATSAGPETLRYYLGVFDNEARARGSELWAPPSATHPLDVAMVLAGLVLLVLAARRRLPPWEWLVVAGVAVETATAARNGIWLLLVLVPAAAAAARGRDQPHAARPTWWVRGLTAVAVVGVLAVVGVIAARSAQVAPRGTAVVALVREAAHGRPVLADEPLAETLGQAGVTVWASNPIDAFTRPVQGEFLDFLAAGAVPPDAPEVAAVSEDAAVRLLGDGWTELGRLGGYVVLERSG